MIKFPECILVSESFTTISDDARVWFDLVDSLQVLAKMGFGLEDHFAVLYGAVQVDNADFGISSFIGFLIFLRVGTRTGLLSFGN